MHVHARLRTAFTALSPTLEDYLTEPVVHRSSPRPDTGREGLHQRVERIDDLLACLQPALRRLRHYAARRRRLRELLQGSIHRYHSSLLIRVMDAWSCLASVRREEAFLWARVRTRVDLRVAAGVFTKWYRMTAALSLGRLREVSRFFQSWRRRSLGLARLERWYERRSLLAILEGWTSWRAAFRWKLLRFPRFIASWGRLVSITIASRIFGKARWQRRSLQASLMAWRNRTAEAVRAKQKIAVRQRRRHLLLGALREFRRASRQERFRIRHFRQQRLLSYSVRLWRRRVAELKRARATAKRRAYVRWKLLTRRAAEEGRLRRLTWMLWRRQVVITRVIDSKDRRRFRRTLGCWRATVSEMRTLRLCGGLIARRTAALARRALVLWWSWAVVRLLGRAARGRREMQQHRVILGEWFLLARAVKFHRRHVADATRVWLETWVGRIRRNRVLAEGKRRELLIRRVWEGYRRGVTLQIGRQQARERAAEEMALRCAVALGQRAMRWWKARINLRHVTSELFWIARSAVEARAAGRSLHAWLAAFAQHHRADEYSRTSQGKILRAALRKWLIIALNHSCVRHSARNFRLRCRASSLHRHCLHWAALSRESIEAGARLTAGRWLSRWRLGVARCRRARERSRMAVVQRNSTLAKFALAGWRVHVRETEQIGRVLRMAFDERREIREASTKLRAHFRAWTALTELVHRRRDTVRTLRVQQDLDVALKVFGVWADHCLSDPKRADVLRRRRGVRRLTANNRLSTTYSPRAQSLLCSPAESVSSPRSTVPTECTSLRSESTFVIVAPPPDALGPMPKRCYS
ncbi:hypothetical protein FOZ63_023562 [Perkinsus olseni]|uniref:Sfi1 spindle body domain-containing protein n=1 Tax=Perkinsus olseni TaxID=32597 RepID=A0A7J6TFH9_PEROL|nr:hypothetical protein FOZ63_023562 [Perkinsus olseni]